ncbi:hypothetical protein PGT21_002149 [Puccinia graminis f. sp. tritici]|nr:hypothetical protein PGTUg99_006189 [Puccinia graminis f. sp. tritici]KAA1080318.1 hypothetical protein PGT21_002149 [Puccinia graminis f. sp. tritici]
MILSPKTVDINVNKESPASATPHEASDATPKTTSDVMHGTKELGSTAPGSINVTLQASFNLGRSAKPFGNLMLFSIRKTAVSRCINKPRATSWQPRSWPAFLFG